MVKRFKGFTSRIDAGRELAMAFGSEYYNQPDLVVLFISQNSVPIAHEVARGMRASAMDVFLRRNIPIPHGNGATLGYATSGGGRALRKDVALNLGISEQWADSFAKREELAIQKDEDYFRGQRPQTSIKGKQIVVVDDGFTPTSLLQDALGALRELGASKVVLAVPIATAHLLHHLAGAADAIIRTHDQTGETTLAWYGPFQQVNKEQVRLHLLLWKPEERRVAA